MIHYLININYFKKYNNKHLFLLIGLKELKFKICNIIKIFSLNIYLFNKMKEFFYHIKIYLKQHLNFL